MALGTRGPFMQVQQIRYFLALVEEQNFTRAARRCGVSQPSLTGSIRRLEAELGGQLFTRKPKVSVTSLGRAVAPYLGRIARDVEDALRAARSFHKGANSRSETQKPRIASAMRGGG
jgi:LysR family transcriptional regulator, hydrogen peroxide-inducible genes activator